MKKYLLLFISVLLPFAAYSDKLTVNVETEGTLEDVISDQDVLKITDLTITGRLTASDIIYLRSGKGRMANLETLDLKDVTLVASTEPYNTFEYRHFHGGGSGKTYCYISDSEETKIDSYYARYMGSDAIHYIDEYFYGKNLAGAFSDMHLKKVVLPSTVHKIGEYCFTKSTIETVEAPGGITEIEFWAFAACSSLKNIPSTSNVKKIDYNAFASCWSLESCDLSKVEFLGSSAFSGCTSLGGIVNLPLLTEIPDKAFGSSNITKVIAPKVVTIGRSAFESCKSLASISFNSLQSIGESAFEECLALTSINLPNSAKNIGDRAFYGCKNLTEVSLASTLDDVMYSSFEGTPWLQNHGLEDGMLFVGHVALCYFRDSDMAPNWTLKIKEGTVAVANDFTVNWRNGVTKTMKNITNVVFPSTLKRIGNKSFKDFVGLTKLSFPASLKIIGENAFPSTIEQVDFSEGLEEIGSKAFYECGSIEELNLPTSLRKMDENAFGNCTGLLEITIPENVEELRNAFNGCSGIIIVRMNAKHLHKESSYFYEVSAKYATNSIGRLSGLEKIIIGSQVEVLPSELFINSPKKVVFEDRSPDSRLYWGNSCINISTIKSIALPNCKIAFGGFGSWFNSSNSNDTDREIRILGEITEISGPFNSSTKEFTIFKGDIRLSDELTEIPEKAFYNCVSISSVNFPRNLKSIGGMAFSNCYLLSGAIVFPNSLTSIGGGAFGNCTGITSVTIPVNMTDMGAAFSGCTSLTSAIFHSKEAGPLGTNSLKEIIIGDETTTISDRAFSGCSGLTSVTMGKNVNSIGERAFYNCSSLKDFTIPDGVTSIGKEAFSGCSALTSFTIPDGVASIEERTFEKCTGLTTIKIPNSVKIIKQWAFYNTHLPSVTIPSSVTNIEYMALSMNSNYLTSITTLNRVPPTADINFAYQGTYEYRTLYVPAGTKSAYYRNGVWGQFKNIVEMASEPGDVSGDNEVNGTDIVALVNVIMAEGNNPAADVNGDGEVNGTDIVALVNIIMNADNSREMMAARSADGMSASASIVTIGAEPMLTNGDGSRELTITMTNPQMDVTMVQMDVTLPEGLTLTNDDETPMMAGRTTVGTHQLYAATNDGGRNARLMLASGRNALIEGTKGGIMRLTLKADENFQGGDIVLHDILCTSPSLKEERPADVIIRIDSTTGITDNKCETINNNGSAYDLQGRHIDPSIKRKGVIIVNGKKLIK